MDPGWLSFLFLRHHDRQFCGMNVAAAICWQLERPLCLAKVLSFLSDWRYLPTTRLQGTDATEDADPPTREYVRRSYR
jgi:hypothetical protein